MGPRARLLGAGAIAAGLAPEAVKLLATSEEAAHMLEETLGASDVVLFKASRGVGLDRAVAILLGEVA